MACLFMLPPKLFKLSACADKHRVGYPDPSAFCSNVRYVLAEELCFIFRKHEVRSKHLVYSGTLFSVSVKQISFAKTRPTLLQKAEGSGYPSPCKIAYSLQMERVGLRAFTTFVHEHSLLSIRDGHKSTTSKSKSQCSQSVVMSSVLTTDT